MSSKRSIKKSSFRVAHLTSWVRNIGLEDSMCRLRKSMIKYQGDLLAKFVFVTDFRTYVEHGRPPRSRVLKAIVSNCLFSLVCLRHIICFLTHRPAVWVRLGDPLYVTGDRIVFNFGIAFVFITAFFLRFHIYLGEWRYRNYFIEDMLALVDGDAETERALDGRNYQRYARLFKVYTFIYCVAFSYSCFLLPMACYSLYCAQAWWRHDFDYNSVVLFVSAAGFNFGAYTASFTILLSLSFMVLSLTNIRLQYQQITERVLRQRKQNHLASIGRTLAAHKRLSARVFQYNVVLSQLLFSIYFCMTPAIDALMYFSFIARTIVFVSCSLFVVLCCATTIVFTATYAPASLHKEVGGSWSI